MDPYSSPYITHSSNFHVLFHSFIPSLRKVSVLNASANLHEVAAELAPVMPAQSRPQLDIHLKGFGWVHISGSKGLTATFLELSGSN